MHHHTSTLLIALTLAALPVPARADRLVDFNKLEAEYKTVETDYFKARAEKKNATPGDNIQAWDAWPGWKYLPKFVALAEENPDDGVAVRCCQWIFDRTRNVGTEARGIFPADQKAWQLLAAHHSQSAEVPQLCLDAVQYMGPAREEFLRNLLQQKNLPKVSAGYANLALAELLATKCDYIEQFKRAEKHQPKQTAFAKHITDQRSPEFVAYISNGNIPALKEESIDHFHIVLKEYADVPILVAHQHHRPTATLGKRAENDLYALEHLSIGALAPDIAGEDLDGHPVKLENFRGRVVLLSFWFTGCGPCMAMIPEEQKLIDNFKDRPFTLLGICSDSDRDLARKTAKTEKITWTCVFDGDTSGPVNRAYNIQGWPTFYLIDKNGRIVAKDMDRDSLADDIAELLDKVN